MSSIVQKLAYPEFHRRRRYLEELPEEDELATFFSPVPVSGEDGIQKAGWCWMLD